LATPSADCFLADHTPSAAIGPSESPRPLSKVRTSFIAIEKDGRIGLQRDPSSDSVPSLRRQLTGDTQTSEAAPAAPTLPEKTSFASDRFDRGSRAGVAMEPIPQSPSQEASGRPAAALAAGPAFSSPSKAAEGKGKEAPAGDRIAAKDSKPKDSKPAEVGKTQSKKAEAAGGASTTVGSAANLGPGGRRPEPVSAVPTRHEAAAKAPSKEAAPKAAASRAAPPKAISTTKAAAGKPSAKSPTIAKTPTSPTKPQTPKVSSRAAAAADKNATPKTAASSSKKKPLVPPEIDLSPLSRGIGFVKPKPKSPTRPVQLPAGLTTHTAASATKVNPSRQSLSRQSGSYQTIHSLGRAPSRASTAGTTTKGLKRQNSTISRQRPSFGPPPQPRAQDHPVAKREKAVDEGFLARMMRPTQSSSSKTADKVPVTPPRKPSVAPAKRSAAARETSRARTPVATDLSTEPVAIKKIVPRAAAPPAEVPKAEASAAKTIAPAVEQKATAEEAIRIAKAAEGTVPLPETTQTPAAAEPARSEPEGEKPPHVEITEAEEQHDEVAPEVTAEHDEAAAAAATDDPTLDAHHEEKSIDTEDTLTEDNPLTTEAEEIKMNHVHANGTAHGEEHGAVATGNQDTTEED